MYNQIPKFKINRNRIPERKFLEPQTDLSIDLGGAI